MLNKNYRGYLGFVKDHVSATKAAKPYLYKGVMAKNTKSRHNIKMVHRVPNGKVESITLVQQVRMGGWAGSSGMRLILVIVV